jgi:hypothetical protein
VDQSPETDQLIARTDLEAMPYDKRWRQYRLRIQPGDVKKEADVLRALIKLAAGEGGPA